MNGRRTRRSTVRSGAKRCVRLRVPSDIALLSCFYARYSQSFDCSHLLIDFHISWLSATTHTMSFSHDFLVNIDTKHLSLFVRVHKLDAATPPCFASLTSSCDLESRGPRSIHLCMRLSSACACLASASVPVLKSTFRFVTRCSRAFYPAASRGGIACSPW